MKNAFTLCNFKILHIIFVCWKMQSKHISEICAEYGWDGIPWSIKYMSVSQKLAMILLAIILWCARQKCKQAGAELCQAHAHFNCKFVRLSSFEIVFLWDCLPLMLPSREFVFLWGCLPVMLSSFEVVFLWGCLSVGLSSCEVVFLRGCLPVRLFSYEVFFLRGCLPVRLSSISNPPYKGLVRVIS